MSVFSLHAAALKALLPLLVSTASAQADATAVTTVDIFTTADRPITIPAAARRPASAVTIYYLDGLEQLEADLSQALPLEPAAAEAETLRRLQAMEADRLASARESAHGLALASQYGIDRAPAIVIDGHAVVYGVSDLRAALAHYRRWRERAP